jgi:hypothetical protein
MYFSMASFQRTASTRLPTTTIALALPSSSGATKVAEVLDHNLHLLRDVVRVQPDPAHDALHGGAALHRAFRRSPALRAPA